ncbi:MAG: hypothetical protein PHE18_02800 [Candidatus Omnitrophica bacterium]|nr:hypothetical protein [Candidatus Omnitrophota bacterium]
MNINSWGSVFAGMVIMLIVQFSLSLLGVAFGFLSISPQEGRFPKKALAFGGIAWWVITSIVAVYLGSWVASRLANAATVGDARLYGIITWAATMLVGVLVSTVGAGIVASGAIGMLSQAIKAVGAIGAVGGAAGIMGAGAVMKSPEMFSEVFPKLSGQLQGVTNRIKDFQHNQEAKQEISSVARDIIKKGPENINESDKERFSDVLTKVTDMSHEETRQKVDQFISQAKRVNEQVQQGLEKSKMAAKEAAKAVSAAAFASFIMLALTFAAAILGSTHGAITIMP